MLEVAGISLGPQQGGDEEAGTAAHPLDFAGLCEADGGQHHAGRLEGHVDGVRFPVAPQQLCGAEAHLQRSKARVGRMFIGSHVWCGDAVTLRPVPQGTCTHAVRRWCLGIERDEEVRTASGMGQPLAKVEVWVKGACARSSRFSISSPCSTGTSTCAATAGLVSHHCRLGSAARIGTAFRRWVLHCQGACADMRTAGDSTQGSPRKIAVDRCGRNTSISAWMI